MKQLIKAGSLLLLSLVFRTMDSAAQDSILTSYIREGINSNIALKQKEMDYAKSLLALKEAGGLFFPDISLNARYTLANGGRVIEFPVGDLLNPVYSTLNMLTASSSFPSVENMEFSFYRPREHETKATLVQPIFSPELYSNYKIKKDLVGIGACDLTVYKRELIKAITTAYYELKKVLLLQQLAEEARLLLEENVRVSRSLFENDKLTLDVVYRSEAELAKIETQLVELNGWEQTARAYFNFLLNRPFEEKVEFGADLALEAPLADLASSQDAAASSREELELLDYYIELNRHRQQLEQGGGLPSVYGVINYGFQGEDYSFTADDDFVLASVVLQWDLFNGMTRHNKIKQLRLEGEQLELRQTESDRLIRLEVLETWSAMNSAYHKVQSADKQLASSRKAYEMIDRKFREGEASLLEYIDARTNMTNAGTEKIIATTDFYIQKAAWDRALALEKL